MKKLYWIIGLILVFFAGDRLGGWLLGQLAGQSQFRYSRLYQQKAQSDILLLGNSRGLIFYQPYIEELTGQSTFNFSYNGLPIDLGQVLLADYLDRYENPDILLIDVSMCDRINNQLVSGFNLYSPHSQRLDQLIVDSIPTVAYAGRLSHLFRYNGEVFQRALYYLGKSDEYWLNEREMNEHLVQTVAQSDSLRFHLPGNTLGALSSTVRIAKKKGLTVRLLVNPYYSPYAERFIDFDRWLQNIELATGMKVYDYSQAIKDVKAFSDYQHLNQYGARLYIDLLKKDGLLEVENPTMLGCR
ncbi:MAG: hypothetical protein AAFP19_24855 [Bacteroidota bacterium]